MDWTVLFDEDFAAWLDGLDADVRRVLLAHVMLLREHGPNLGRPHFKSVPSATLRPDSGMY